MSGKSGAASRDKDWDGDKLRFNPEALMEATPGTEPMRRPRASPLAINAAAIGAILLRDIKLRAGPYYTGFLMILLMPLVHLLIVVTAFRIFGRLAPQGTDQVVYFGVSILPFVIYTYLSRQVVISLTENRPLLYFNRAKVFDILLARVILEATGSVGIFFSIFPYRCFGSPPAFFIFPSAIPDPYDRWLALNPLLQCVEWIRYAYYEDYPDKLLNIPYLITFATACLAVSLIAERLARRVLLSK
jgi:capsular polysaccharide transport system permease protein